KTLSVYFVIRTVLSFLPEMTELGTSKFSSRVSDVGYVPSESKWMLYIVITSLLFIGFVICTVISCRAFAKYSKDKTTVSGTVGAALDEKSRDPEAWDVKLWKIYRVIFVLGAVFSVYVYIDGIDYLPKIMAALVLASLSLICARTVFERVVTVSVNVLLSVFSVISTNVLGAYFKEYNSEVQSVLDAEAGKAYFTVTVVLIILASLHFVSFMLMTEYVKRKRTDAYLSSKKGKEAAKKLSHGMLGVRISAAVSFAAAVAFPLLRAVFPEIIVILIFSGVVTAVFSYFTYLTE
ncbi:MAG: hypothetical protein IKN38_08685, partial [Clostridia bacterium]|nr:hypothetical protein [Clostridia bacterium]